MWRLFVTTGLLAQAAAQEVPLSAGPTGAAEVNPSVPFVQTPQRVVEAMLALAHVGPGDVVYDLGSGDGRIVVTAARQHGARAVGVELHPQLVTLARQRAREAGVEARTEFRQEDLLETDLREATVVTLYLGQVLNEKLRPRLLAELRPGTRIVSRAFSMGEGWKPERVVRAAGSTLYLWRVPAR